MPKTGERLLRLADEVMADPLKLSYVNLLKAAYLVVPERMLPVLPQGPGKEFENLSPALVMMACAGKAEADMERRNIPEDQRQWIRAGHERAVLSREAAVGYPAMSAGSFCWRRRTLIPSLFMIRDMEFELKVMNGAVTVYQEKATGKLVGLREDGQTETEFLCTRLLRGGEPGETVILSKEAYEAYVRLGEYVLAHHSAGFPLSGEETQEVQIPVFRIKVAGILYIVPGAGGEGHQFVPEFFRITDGISVTAEFKPPIIGGIVIQIDISLYEILFCQRGTPFGRCECYFSCGFSALNQTGHSHGHGICNTCGGIFSEFRIRFSSQTIFSAAKRSQNTVSGTVTVILCLHLIKLLCGHLIPGNAFDSGGSSVGIVTRLHGSVHTGTV
jgi:hypothetical protein